MRCDPDQIVCALDELGKVLREISQPGILDVLAGVVVPIILGVATVILAIFTIRTSQRSNQLAVELEDRREAKEARNRRLAAVPDLIEWATLELLIGHDKHEPISDLRKFRKRVTDLERTTGEPSIENLSGWIRARVTEYHDSSEDDALATYYRRIYDMVVGWAEDPAAVDRARMRDARVAALESRLRRNDAEHSS